MSETDSDDPRQRVQSVFAQLPPELRRAARWVLAHMPQAALWSMRRQAQEVGVAPATMLRLARASGYGSYDEFRAACQQAATGGLRHKAAQLQASQADVPPRHDALTMLQVRAVQSACEATPAQTFDAAADALLGARLVGFLGIRSSFGIASQMYYGYQLLQRNGLLLDGLGCAPAEQADTLQAGDVLVAISQSPYTALTARTAQRCVQRGVELVALTDAALSPIALQASHTLLFDRPHPRRDAAPSPNGPGSFFHTTAGLLALAEHLLARLAARGGEAVLGRLAEVETRLHAEQTYWSADAPAGPGRRRPSAFLP